MEKITFKKPDELDYQAKEAFKALRTNILFCGDDIKTICVTSSIPGEGKTSVAMQIALSFADAGKRILFIDADIRRSVVAGRYKAEGEIFGLSHYMIGQRGMDEIIYQVGDTGMDIVFAGPTAPNPSELLEGPRFSRLLDVQREHYDYIIVDAPPLGSVIDAAIIAHLTDGAIIVVESCAVSYKMVQNVKRQLEKSECRILGVVLNKVYQDKNGYYYGDYYKRYYNGAYGKYGDYYGKKQDKRGK